MPPIRQTKVESRATAECQDCAWRSSGRNAQGIAARHHDSRGHLVVVHVETEITYGDPNRALPGQTRMAA